MDDTLMTMINGTSPRGFHRIAVKFVVAIFLSFGSSASAQQVTVFPPASLPLSGAETMYLIQGGHSKETQIGNINAGQQLPVINAAAFGVVADGITSNDQSLGMALAACSAQGARLVLPPGKILLTGATLTSTATRLIQNCALTGAGPLTGGTISSAQGTQFNITSTSVAPFVLGQNFAVIGVNLYWPGQTGAVVYPPAFVGQPGSGKYVARGYFQNVSLVNAYDGVAQSNYNSGGSCPGTYASSSCPETWVDVTFDNYRTFAAHDDFRWNFTSDGMTLQNVRVLPGAWLGLGGTAGQVGTAAHSATAFHVASSGGGQVNINATDLVVVGARYGILVDSGAIVAESQFSATWDAVGTIVDTSAGGSWYGYGVQFTGVGTGCYTPSTTWGGPATGNAPCFNLGNAANNEFVLNDFKSAGSQGDFIKTTGTDIILTNSESLGVGAAVDGNDYYQVNINSTGSPRIRVQNNRFVGVNGSVHAHGITTTAAGIPNALVIQGNTFDYFNDDVTASFPQGAIVSGNTSFDTISGNVSFNQSNAASIVYYGNFWDATPKPTVSACGTSPTVASASGPNSGFITIGTGTATTCTITMPLSIAGFCQFQSSASISIGGGPSGSPPAWLEYFYQGASNFNAAGYNLFYTCPGQQ